MYYYRGFYMENTLPNESANGVYIQHDPVIKYLFGNKLILHAYVQVVSHLFASQSDFENQIDKMINNLPYDDINAIIENDPYLIMKDYAPILLLMNTNKYVYIAKSKSTLPIILGTYPANGIPIVPPPLDPDDNSIGPDEIYTNTRPYNWIGMPRTLDMNEICCLLNVTPDMDYIFNFILSGTYNPDNPVYDITVSLDGGKNYVIVGDSDIETLSIDDEYYRTIVKCRYENISSQVIDSDGTRQVMLKLRLKTNVDSLSLGTNPKTTLCVVNDNLMELRITNLQLVNKYFGAAYCDNLRYIRIEKLRLDTNYNHYTSDISFEADNSLICVTALDLTSVKIVDKLFAYCKSLRAVPILALSKSADFTSCESMFNGCSSLTYCKELHLEKCEDASSLLRDAVKLIQSPKIISDNTVNMDAGGMFRGCSNLEKINFSFDHMDGLYRTFNGCSKLVNLPKIRIINFDSNDGSTWTTLQFNNTFAGCSKLEDVDFYTDQFEEPWGYRGGISFRNCNLTHIAMVRIINHLPKVVNRGTLLDFMGCPGGNLLTDSEIKIAKDKGWLVLYGGYGHETTLPPRIEENSIFDIEYKDAKDLYIKTRPSDWISMPDGNMNEIYLLYKFSETQYQDIFYFGFHTDHLVNVSYSNNGIIFIPVLNNVSGDVTYQFHPSSSGYLMSNQETQLMIKIELVEDATNILPLDPTAHKEPYEYRNNGLVEVKICDNSIYLAGFCLIDSDIIYASIGDSGIETCAEMFRGCKRLQIVYYFNEQITDIMDSMFKDCHNLIAIQNLNGENVLSASNAFENCYSLRYLPETEFPNIKDIGSMFKNCYMLESISKFNISSVVTSASEAFSSCINLKTVSNLSIDEDKEYRSIDSPFYSCYALNSVNNITLHSSSINYLFNFCLSLESIDNFMITKPITSAKGAFFLCRLLPYTELKDFDFSHVIDLSDAFYECTSLTQVPSSFIEDNNCVEQAETAFAYSGILDLIDFPMAHIKNMDGFISGCILEHISLDPSHSVNIDDLFITLSESTYWNSISFDSFRNLITFLPHNDNDNTAIIEVWGEYYKNNNCESFAKQLADLNWKISINDLRITK